ncbi:MAG: heme A synthase [Gammaproteobacteria bacterium]|nr:MAG: heme A synthase [Gammaproteobacteria bacterium]
MPKSIRPVAAVACLLAFAVVVLGAYVRLSHAGLGCPDWPGCYGHLVVPDHPAALEAAARAHPDRPLDAPKAWKEMVHRYAAGLLGVLVFALAALAWWNRPQAPAGVALALAALIVGQALLGMLTVTWLLKPLVVTAHLLGGFATLALLWYLVLKTWGLAPPARPVGALAWWVLAALLLQIALGGWTSSNYAALACYGFPQCSGRWWPPMDFSEAFVLWRGLGIDYEGGVLDHPARIAIHMSHRLGAVLVTVLWLALAWRAWRAGGVWRAWSVAAVLLLLAQITLGVVNVTFALPLAAATAHNAVAALLLCALVAMLAAPRRGAGP